MMRSPALTAAKDPLLDEWLLNTPLATINGNVPQRAFAYSARQAIVGGGWPARFGENLTKVASGGTVGSVLGAGPPYAVKCPTGGAYLAATPGFANPGLKDFIFEVLAAPAVGANYATSQYFLVKGSDPVGFGDFLCLAFIGASNSTLKASFGAQIVYPALFTLYSANLSEGYHHIWAAVNRDEASVNGARMGVDGSLSGTGVNPSVLVASDITTNKPLALGGNWDATGFPGAPGCLVAVQAWYGGDISDNFIAAGAAGQTEIEAVMAKRFAMSL